MTDRLCDVDHTPPERDPAGRAWFRRGPGTATDGGRPADGDPADEDAERDVTTERMGDVSHTPSDGDGANRVWDGTRVRPDEGDDE